MNLGLYHLSEITLDAQTGFAPMKHWFAISRISTLPLRVGYLHRRFDLNKHPHDLEACALPFKRLRHKLAYFGSPNRSRTCILTFKVSCPAS